MSEEKDKDIRKLELTPFERLILIGMLPQRSSRHKGILINQIDESLSLTDDEMVRYKAEFHPQGTSFGKDPEGDPFEETKEFEFPKEKMKIIEKAMKDADREERLPVDEKVHELYDKIVE